MRFHHQIALILLGSDLLSTFERYTKNYKRRQNGGNSIYDEFGSTYPVIYLEKRYTGWYKMGNKRWAPYIPYSYRDFVSRQYYLLCGQEGQRCAILIRYQLMSEQCDYPLYNFYFILKYIHKSFGYFSKQN